MICNSDVIAIGAMSAHRKLGLRVSLAFSREKAMAEAEFELLAEIANRSGAAPCTGDQ